MSPKSVNVESVGGSSLTPVSKVWLHCKKLAVIQYVFVDISYTKFFLNQVKNVESTDRISLTPTNKKMALTSLMVTKLITG
jgi:hypothetical protein